MSLNVAWPWFAPIGTFVFLVFGVIVSRRWGSVTAEQQIFINNQKHLFAKPTASHYGLLVFAVATIAACMVLPDWLYAVLS
ncbi:hypothetical protein VAEU17_4200001 [Vibrio aestuarianus]|nr:hypothetical protein VAEU17_4200001 [Vibrio aestuarianus]